MLDKKLFTLVEREKKRQEEEITLIPSENYISTNVRKALGSYLSNKYSEGYPNKRYYGGNAIIDEIEILAQERAKKLFNVPYVNVQPYSGSPANFAVYLATCKPGDYIMGLNLPDGGHLTHGWKASSTSIFWKSIPYHVKNNGKIDFDEMYRLAKKYKPKLIWAGATAYVYIYDYKKFSEIADSVNAYFAADISHIAGLIIGGTHPSPVPYAHIITTTTHKTLRGPRGALIMVTKKGIEKDTDLTIKIDKAVFPGLQGGPHNQQTAAIAVALYEASKPTFKKYAKKMVTNAKVLAESLKKSGIKIIGNTTENHMIIIDLTKSHGIGAGIFAEKALETIGITVNKNTIPKEKSTPFYPSGIRIGTPAVTTRGMGNLEMKKIAKIITDVLNQIKEYKLPKDKIKRQSYLNEFLKDIKNNKKIKSYKSIVSELALKFPIKI